MKKSTKIWLRVLIYTLVLLVVTGICFIIGIFATAIHKQAVIERYSASSLLYIKYNSDDYKMTSAEDFSNEKLADNVLLIFKNSEKIHNIIPAGFSTKVSSVEDTNILEITVTGRDPQVCADTANAILNLAPEVLSEYWTGMEARVFEMADVPDKPNNNYMKTYLNISLILTGVGIIFVAIIVISIELIFAKRRKKLSKPLTK